MTRALLLTGGPGHPAEASVEPLRAAAAGVGIDLDVHDDIVAGLDALGADHDLVLVNALAFSMPHPRYDAVRAEAAFTLPPAQAEVLADWHGAGKPVVGLHTAVISFDTWPGWGDILGGRWDWDASFHPPLGRCEVRIGDRTVELTDEAYRDLALADDLDVVAWTVVEGEPQPAAWTRAPAGGGRVAVDLLGHDRRSLEHPAHVDLLAALLAWAVGDTDAIHLDDSQETHR